MDLAAPRHVESSWARNWTHITCIGRRILIHCATRKVLDSFSLDLSPDGAQTWHSLIIPTLKLEASVSYILSSVQFSRSVVSYSLQPHGLQHTGLPCPSQSPGACSNSCPLIRWCHSTISSSVIIPFSACLQYFPVSESFPTSQLFTSGGQTIGASTSASDLPLNIQSWFPLGLTGLISSMSKGVSRVFSSIRVWRHQFFGAQPFLLSSSHICTWLLEKP